MSKQKFKISVVMPIYNTEGYLEEAIDSVVNQTIGFEENIELILVNDGSTDGSKDICLKYQEKYPDNIIYVEQKNSGVSAARNTGIKLIKGTYVNFMDSDDKWALDAFEIAYNYLLNNKEKISIAACRVKFFGRKKDYSHILDYKFYETRIVDIFNEYDAITKAVNNLFIDTKLIKNIKFSSELKYAEDMRFISEIMISNHIMEYGIIREAEYLYRKREEQNSALDKQLTQKSNYIEISEECFLYLLNMCEKEYGYIPEYYQFLVIHDLQFRIKNKLTLALSNEEIELFKKYTKEILNDVSDHIILKVKNISAEQKIMLLNLKHDKDITENLRYEKGKLYYNNLNIYNLGARNLVRLDFINIVKNNVVIEGQIKYIFKREQFDIYARANNTNYNLKISSTDIDEQLFLNEKFIKIDYFKVEIPIKSNNFNIKFIVDYKNKFRKKVGLLMSNFTHLKLENQYRCENGHIIFLKDSKIIIRKSTLKNLLIRKVKFTNTLIKSKKYKSLIYRLVYYICKLFKRKPVWIVTDRPYVARDNGEAVFEYLIKNEKKAKVYFALTKDSEDYERMKEVGKVLDYNSKKYKIKFLLSDIIISSQADDWVVNAFGKGRDYLNDLYKFKFVFLQHGIIKDDLSSWLKKPNKDIKIFVTSVIPEYESIINGNYLYTKNEVKLTGLPRYDKLIDRKEKKIIIMPTWRQSLASSQDRETGKRNYSESFKDSDYFKFYNDLINDKRIIKCLKDKDYIGELFVHPSHSAQDVDFSGNDVIKIHQGVTDYNKEFCEASLLITDYSSVSMDFSYLKKPVIYSQFDRDTFFSNHLYKEGYFSYEQDGFGPVCYDYESTVKAIINAIENDCVNDKKYLDRVNKFFKYTDTNNCKRVYEEIKKL